MRQELHALRIALADDDDISLRYIELMLKSQGHQVIVRAQDGEELIAGCARQPVDLIIADIRMPNVDGIDAIRTIYAHRPVPVILVSGFIDREILDRANREVVLAYLVKPIKPADLATAIVTAMRRFADIERLRRDAAILSLARSDSLRLVAAGIASQCAGHFRKILDSCHLLETYTAADEQAQRLLKAIRTSTEQIARVATSLHDYTGTNIRDSVPLSLSGLVAQAKDLLNAVASDKAQLLYDLNPDLPLIYGDANKIKESLLTLVINGLEAHGPDDAAALLIATGTAKLSSREKESVIVGTADDGTYAFLEVRDRGLGMDPAIIRRIFDPFFTTKFLGRGLGLPAVAGVVRSHGGLIVVESAPGSGTRVRLYFPIAPGEG